MDKQQIITNFEINIEASKESAIGFVKVYLQKIMPSEAESLSNNFTQIYEKALLQHEKEDQNDLARFYHLIIEFKPALTAILKPGKEFDNICDYIAQQFNLTLDRVRRQINEGKPQKKQMGTGVTQKDQTIHLQYFCTVCKQSFEIPPDIQKQLLNSDEKVSLPKHHDKEMVVKIGESEKEKTPEKEQEDKIKIEIYPAELLMQHLNSAESSAEYLKLVSVGIDVGSSTTHLVFSRLTLKREKSFFNMSNRFNLVNREMLYEGNIIFTPLLDPTNIDIESVVAFCKEEYKKANITPEQVDTGAVIVTGETAKKKNAAEIVRRLASESGKFVSASAGPNYESVLAATGSGILELSRVKQNTILNVDVGGGSSKLAIVSKGIMHSTSSINVGGRLLGIDPNFKIWRIDGPTEVVMKELNIKYQIGDIILEKHVRAIASEYAKALIEVMRRPATNSIAKSLMMTDDLDFSLPIDEISFSGGVSEFIYKRRAELKQGTIHYGDNLTTPYNDIGLYLADEILRLMENSKLPLVEPENKIRATVIGAGAFSLSVSGSTCYYDPKITLPIDNIPVVSISMNFRDLLVGGEVKIRKFNEKISNALNNFNLVEGVDIFALFFNDIYIRANLSVFTKALEAALPNSFLHNKLTIIILGFDGAKMLGLTIKKETALKENLFCLDELFLEDGDWIDIGKPLGESQAFPITIKSLVFNQNKQKESVRTKSGPEQGSFVDKAPLTKKQPLGANNQISSKPFALSPSSSLNPEKIIQSFKQFQAEHIGYEILVVLTPEGELEFTTDKSFLTPKDAKNILKAWQEHEPAFVIGENRFPIVSWDQFLFAASNTKGKGIVVGTKTKTNRFILMKVDPGTKMKPNIAALAAKLLNQWSWELI
jgi:ethanolamine utilization protein EutA